MTAFPKLRLAKINPYYTENECAQFYVCALETQQPS